MDLSDYIATTVTEILKGVKQASEKAKEYGGAVNPKALGGSRTSSTYEINDLVLVDFDVAVIVRENSKGAGEAKLSVLSFSASGGGSLEKQSESANKISFRIPIQLPMSEKVGAFTRVPARERAGGK